MAQTQDPDSDAAPTDAAGDSGTLADISTVERDENGILRSACCGASIVLAAAGDIDRLVQECENCGQRV